MALTLADHAMQSSDLFAQGYVKIFVEESPIMEMMPFKKIRGDAYKYRQEATLSGVQWRRVNEDYQESTGALHALTEPLMIVGGEIFADNFILQTQASGPDGIDHWVTQSEMKARALAREYSRAFFYGDWLIDPDEMEGLRRRLISNQVLLAGAGGASLTMAMLDELIDTVIGTNRVLFMHKTLRRKLTSLIRAAGGSINVTYESVNGVGEQVKSYDGIPIYVIEDRGNAASILGFVEDPGDGVQDTASIYCVNFDEEEGVHGIYNGDGPMVRVRDLGEDQDSPGKKGRVEFFTGMVLKHPRGAARLRALLAA